MLAIFSYFFATQTLLIAACCITSYLISRNPIAPTLTYRLSAVGFFILFIKQLQVLFYSNNVSNFLESFEKSNVIIGQLGGVVGYGFILSSLIYKLVSVKFISQPHDIG